MEPNVKKKETPVKVDKTPLAPGSASYKKKSFGRKCSDFFESEEMKEIREFVVNDVLIPSVKKIIADTVNAVLYPNGDAPRTGASSSIRNPYHSKISYRDEDRTRRSERSDTYQHRGGYSYEDITFKNLNFADEALTKMEEIIDRYNMVSIADLNDIAGVKGTYSDNDYGWTNLRDARTVRLTTGEYILKLPRARDLRR